MEKNNWQRQLEYEKYIDSLNKELSKLKIEKTSIERKIFKIEKKLKLR